ncbi:MAG TPA: DUF937 domain-containing protein [Thermoanaerobaculia bacterium]|nr:DUF937 domain-containing protein [Thermoanaerobaculia bacterium]
MNSPGGTTMNSNSILQELQQSLTPQTIEQMSRQLGTDPAATSSAVTLALPLLLGSLSRNASTPEGAADLDRALGDHDGSVLDDLPGLLGGGASELSGTNALGGGIGAAILRHILGKRRAPVEQGVGRATGLDPAQVAQLLTMLAPLIMGVLGRMKRQKGVGAEQLPQVLEQSRAEIEQREPAVAGLGGVLDANNDGQIADDLARLGSSVLGGLFGAQRTGRAT